ncbi:Hypothetical protein R9X50_00232300 [Acrodontium crateriforme]|uniref:Nudix hydrolase domain-containing protein n=1 Tax=Acrodontium crateriforme TaxID=150365 RepID=A0AAQ3M0S5_9PEZI|nr:Hypothetical protein R9X50_00232300 [Acrodontium crateriforme]
MAETTRMQLVDWLDDLTVRFLLNLPASELSSVPRLCFQVEEAQWFYEDFIRPAAAAASKPLPALSLRQFCLLLFQHCPLLSGFTDAQHIAAYEEFLAYKVRVPVRGAIMMDHSMEKLVLVKGWKKGASWSFPRGKINKDEKDLDCAVREVYEETGYDIKAAGLVPENEKDAKYIDITMREQHMRLFVFRGVPETTYFEPKTRKEISKIQWYNVRDLPGFKKSKQRVDPVAHANKFYMVAPFLGPLKKWINQQKKQDTATATNDPAAMQSEYENVSGQYYEEMIEPAFADRSSELLRLLNTGGAPAPPPMPSTAQSANKPQDLLALLQGRPTSSSTLPAQHVLEQNGGFARQPSIQQSPHNQHLRYPLAGYQGQGHRIQPEQHEFMQQQYRSFTQPAPESFGQPPTMFDQQRSPAPQFSGPMHSQMQTAQYQQVLASQNMLQQFGNTNGVQFGLPQRQPAQPPQAPSQSAMQGMQQPHPAGSMAQGSQNAIGSGPAVPKAGDLPMPKMNAHSVNLLNALKSGNTRANASIGHNTGAPSARPHGTHQNALLDLFRKPSKSEPVQASPSVPVPVVQDATPKSSGDFPALPIQQPRRPTLNEITRTLPKPGAKSPVKTDIPVPNKHKSSEHSVDRQKSKQQAEPSHAKAPRKIAVGSTTAPPMTILQRPSSSHATSTPQPPKPQSPKPASKKNSQQSRKQSSAKGAENGTPAPQFTILPRPGSARASQSPNSQNPSSPLRNATPSIGSQQQVHVLKRAEADNSMFANDAKQPQADTEAEAKRDQLLSLFGKPPASSTSSPSVRNHDVVEPSSTPRPATSRNHLLSLFKPPRAAGASEEISAPLPPAPLLVPERKTSHQNVPPTNTQQDTLLGLFNKSSAMTPLQSPDAETPISPFALGTPASTIGPKTLSPSNQQNYHSTVRRTPAPRASATEGGRAAPFFLEPPSKQRINSTASSTDAVPSPVGPAVNPLSRTGSVGGTSTPTEASRGFLLDFLNGVVKKEGSKG